MGARCGVRRWLTGCVEDAFGNCLTEGQPGYDNGDFLGHPRRSAQLSASVWLLPVPHLPASRPSFIPTPADWCESTPVRTPRRRSSDLSRTGSRCRSPASGSGLVAIAAAMAGAAEVTANDIDLYALAAVAVNAAANAVTVAAREGDLLVGDGGDADVILAGDAFYDAELAARMLGFLRRAAARDARVLVGDPGRGHLPRRWLKVLTG
jgi:hypothetical protein